jgi:hypothetical protein
MSVDELTGAVLTAHPGFSGVCELTGAVLTALPGFSKYVCELTGAVLTALPGFSGVFITLVSWKDVLPGEWREK